MNLISVRPPVDLREHAASANQQRALDDVRPWQVLSIVGLLATGGGIALTNAIDLCGPFGPTLLMLSWLIAPVIAIASLVALSASSTNVAERRGVAAFAGVLTIAWMVALVWASIGAAIERIGC